MPRARGGQNNRTDLPGKVPVMAAPDQEYGKQTAQEQSQRIIPIGGTPIPSASPTPGGGPAGPPPATPQAMPLGPNPGELGGISAPPAVPAPATQGLPTGPGAGPEVAGPLMKQHLAQQASEQGTLQTLLQHLASQPGASSITKSLASAAGVRPGS